MRYLPLILALALSGCATMTHNKAMLLVERVEVCLGESMSDPVDIEFVDDVTKERKYLTGDNKSCKAFYHELTRRIYVQKDVEDGVLAHEIAHAVLRDNFTYMDINIEEHLAQYSEVCATGRICK